jgi:hypothetical protein
LNPTSSRFNEAMPSADISMARYALPVLAVVGLAGACGQPIRWTPVPSGTTEDLTSVWCTPAGEVYAVDKHGGAHDLEGHPEQMPWDTGGPVADAGDDLYQIVGRRLRHSTDGGKTWPEVEHARPIEPVTYGRSHLGRVATAGAGAPIYVLGRYTAVSNSLENDYAYLLRSDDRGVTWPQVWTGPDRGPMGSAFPATRQGPDVGAALAVLPDGTVALAARQDGAVLISSDGGKTFSPRRTPASAPLAALWASPGGVLYGVGQNGEIVVSSNRGRSFSAAPSGTTADLAAITGCGSEVWIVGAGGTVLRH